MTEDQLEQEALGWLASVGYTPLNARDPDLDPRLVRASSRDVALVPCLRAAIDRLNPAVPAATREDAFRQVLDMGQPALLSGNRAFHRVLVTGVPVQYQKDGKTRAAMSGWRCSSSASRGRVTRAGPTSFCSSMVCRWCSLS
jgi:type I restriction enzyme R subunit